MRKIFNITVAFVLISVLFSCDSFLDNQPKGYTIPKDFEDYSLLLNDYGLGFFGVEYPIYLSDNVELGEKDVPTKVTFSFKREEERASYSFKHGDIFPEGSTDYFYGDGYGQIYTYNVVANNIMGVPDGAENDKKIVYAEAVTHRAFVYLQLVNVYAKQYDKATANTDYGVPIMLDEDVNGSYKRNSVAEVYELIIDDLKNAIPNLDAATQNPYHPNKTTGYGLLARTYLYMGEFELALENAKKALESNRSSELIDYTKYHVNPNSSASNRITDENDTPMPQRGNSTANLFIKLPPTDISSNVFASKDLMDTFGKNLPSGAIDKREELFYAKDSVNIYENAVFPGYTMYVAHIMPNLGLTLQEIYLTLAECEARVASGTKEQALAYLDILRDKRIVGNTPLTATTKEEALKIALDERRREMAFWGQMRFIDLRRLNKEPKFAKEVVHKLEDENFTLPANDARYIMPLPHVVREFNPTIPQYER